ncbi:GDSL esterase/lipase [Canna indica]|uniref:GDSL esterase/lipase n=1 Tax=Canna indica TaxID=4628 RepID=A0AAQ3KQV7_9LILI|nr:GDSL esterase/lipase [Canna indica]
MALPSLDMALPSLDMALPISICIFLFFFILNQASTSFCSMSPNNIDSTHSFSSIISFGDSLADTENIFYLNPPYKNFQNVQNYLDHPRYSDGRLVIDFIAQELGLPLVPAYIPEKNNNSFEHGVNFAVGGACAMSNQLAQNLGFTTASQDYSLAIQLQWFHDLLHEMTLHNDSIHDNILSNKSLFFIGEMGLNDYYGLYQELNQTNDIDRRRPYVPIIVHEIVSTIEDLIKTGANTILVAGLYPMGCMSAYNTQSTDGLIDPKTGCNNNVNELAKYHNSLLQEELDKLSKVHPQAKILFVNYYDIMMPFFETPKEFGFKTPLTTCIGLMGQRDFSDNITSNTPKCNDTSSYVSWDGIHLTEAAHRIIADHILQLLRENNL